MASSKKEKRKKSILALSTLLFVFVVLGLIFFVLRSRAGKVRVSQEIKGRSGIVALIQDGLSKKDSEDASTIPHGHEVGFVFEDLDSGGGTSNTKEENCDLFDTGILDDDCDWIPNWLEERNDTNISDPNNPYLQGAYNHDGDAINHGMDGHYACDTYPSLLNCNKNLNSAIEAVSADQDTDKGGVPDIMEIIQGINPMDSGDDCEFLGTTCSSSGNDGSGNDGSGNGGSGNGGSGNGGSGNGGSGNGGSDFVTPENSTIQPGEGTDISIVDPSDLSSVEAQLSEIIDGLTNFETIVGDLPGSPVLPDIIENQLGDALLESEELITLVNFISPDINILDPDFSYSDLDDLPIDGQYPPGTLPESVENGEVGLGLYISIAFGNILADFIQLSQVQIPGHIETVTASSVDVYIDEGLTTCDTVVGRIDISGSISSVGHIARLAVRHKEPGGTFTQTPTFFTSTKIDGTLQNFSTSVSGITAETLFYIVDSSVVYNGTPYIYSGPFKCDSSSSNNVSSWCYIADLADGLLSSPHPSENACELAAEAELGVQTPCYLCANINTKKSAYFIKDAFEYVESSVTRIPDAPDTSAGIINAAFNTDARQGQDVRLEVSYRNTDNTVVGSSPYSYIAGAGVGNKESFVVSNAKAPDLYYFKIIDADTLEVYDRYVLRTRVRPGDIKVGTLAIEDKPIDIDFTPGGTLGTGPQGLVPCGNTIADMCQYEDFIALIQKLFKFAFILITPIIAIALLLTGYQYMTSNGNASVHAEAIRKFTNIAKGVFFLSTCWLIVMTIFRLLGVSSAYILLGA